MGTRIAVLDRKALKAKYLDCFAARETSAKTLPEVIRGLLEFGVARETLFSWAIDAGYNELTVRTVLSRAFCALGIRERKEGAGRKPSAKALELLEYAREQYGDLALRILRAAFRAGKAQAKTIVAGKVPESPLETIAGPQLRALGLNDDPQLASANRVRPATKTKATNGKRVRSLAPRMTAKRF
jgi:hypothetical protein